MLRASSIIAVERRVVVAGIVVEGDQALDAGRTGEGDGVGNSAVAPADVVGVLGRAVLRVVDQQVGARGEVVARGPLGGSRGKSRHAERRLVVGQVGERCGRRRSIR